LRRTAAESEPRCLALYRAWGWFSLSAISAKGAALSLVLIGLATSGCSMFQTGGPFARASDDDVTGAVPAQAAKKEPTETDLAFARNAASDVLTKGDKDASQAWENAETGAHGSVTPLAQAYAGEDGRTCRDFLASYVNGETQSWLQGAACKSGNGRWEIHTLKPWRRG
jgi:surface antigen